MSKIALNTLQKVTHYLTKELPNFSRPKGYDGKTMLGRCEILLNELGNPQNQHKTIHVAGTSGKGTVCYMIDAVLRAHGKRTALMVSPHVYDIRERIQINNQYAPEKHFIKAANEVIAVANRLATDSNSPSYFEVMAAIGFVLSGQKNLDYLVLETGLGGKYDISNSIRDTSKYSVLTQIGLDHTQILGTTYEQIASHKAEIIQNNSLVTALKQRNRVNEVFSLEAKKKNAQISWVERSTDYQVDDLMLALDAVKHIAYRDGWSFNSELASKAAQNVYIPGRFEKRTYKNRTVILDGAHNPQKLHALAGRAERELLTPATIVIALGEKNDCADSLKSLRTICARLIVCEFFLSDTFKRRALDSEKIRQIAKRQGYKSIEIVKRPVDALNRALEFSEPIICTGSFYLLGELDKAF